MRERGEERRLVLQAASSREAAEGLRNMETKLLSNGTEDIGRYMEVRGYLSEGTKRVSIGNPSVDVRLSLCLLLRMHLIGCLPLKYFLDGTLELLWNVEVREGLSPSQW